MIIFLLLVILGLIGLVAFMDYNGRKERKTMLNAILAKSVQDMVNLELIDKTEVQIGKQDNKQDLVETSTLTDEEFEKIIEENK